MRIALPAIVIAAMVAAMFGSGTGSEALGAGGSLTFEPDEIVLANIGDTAEVTVVHSGLGEPADSVQLNLSHDESIDIFGLSCIGPFAGALATDSVHFQGGALLACAIVNAPTFEISGPILRFTIKRLTPGDSVIPYVVSGFFPTEFGVAGVSIDPGTLGSLTVLTSAATPTPPPTTVPTQVPTSTAVPTVASNPTATPTPRPTSTPRPASTATPIPTPTPTPAAVADATSTSVPDPSPSPLPAATATPTPSTSSGPTPTHTPTPPPRPDVTAATVLVTATTIASTRVVPTAPPTSTGVRNPPSPAPTARPDAVSPTRAPTALPVPTPAPLTPELIAQQPVATPAASSPGSDQEPSPTAQAIPTEEAADGGTCNGTDGGLNMGVLGILGLPALIGARKLKRNG